MTTTRKHERVSNFFLSFLPLQPTNFFPSQPRCLQRHTMTMATTRKRTRSNNGRYSRCLKGVAATCGLLLAGTSTTVPVAQAQEVQHFENLLRGAGGFQAPSDANANADADAVANVNVKSDGSMGPIYEEIASLIASAGGKTKSVLDDGVDDNSNAHAHQEEFIIDVPACRDQEGETAIRINGNFVTCAMLGQYCDQYQQVKDACPAT